MIRFKIVRLRFSPYELLDKKLKLFLIFSRFHPIGLLISIRFRGKDLDFYYFYIESWMILIEKCKLSYTKNPSKKFINYVEE